MGLMRGEPIPWEGLPRPRDPSLSAPVTEVFPGIGLLQKESEAEGTLESVE